MFKYYFTATSSRKYLIEFCYHCYCHIICHPNGHATTCNCAWPSDETDPDYHEFKERAKNLDAQDFLTTPNAPHGTLRWLIYKGIPWLIENDEKDILKAAKAVGNGLVQEYFSKQQKQQHEKTN